MRSLTIALFLFVFFHFSSAQNDVIKRGPKNSWIRDYSYNPKARPESEQGESSYYLLIDEQENHITQEDYHHYAYVVLNTDGIQDMSDIMFYLDPAYHKLTVHELKVIRGNTIVDQMPETFNLIQREQSMDRYLYDGSKTAVVNLRDIRVGDIVEYSFTRKGYNPVYGGHISQQYYFDNFTYDALYRRMIVPASKNLTVKELGTNVPKPTITRKEKTVEYAWTVAKNKFTPIDQGVPIWHNISKIVMISDFQSWEEVGQWAKDLFVLDQDDVTRLQNEAAKLFPASNDEEYVLKVIRFVQDEIRYLGFESGINSHKPHPPLQVYEQRFGDCKDKSLLLISLLKARNVEAYPMLVNTSLKHAIDDRIPGGHLFDHCVVKIIFGGKTIYIDPTSSNQGGGLSEIYFPDYSRGLVLDNDMSGLDVLPEPMASSTTEIQEFDLLTVGGEAMLTIRTSYTGADADINRSYFANTPIESVKQNYKNYYANLYPDIIEWEEPKITDHRENNVLIVEEKYKVPEFWKPIEGQEGQIFCTVSQQSMISYVEVPKNIQQRTTPYYQNYPVDLFHTIHIRLPEKWTITSEDQLIENDYYQYEYEVRAQPKEISLLTHYKTKKNHIPADQITTFVNDHAKMYNNIGYQLTYDTRALTASSPWAGVLLTVVALAGGAFLMFYLYHRYDPAPFRFMKIGTPIGGWLILLSLGVIFTPFRLIFDFINEPLLINGDGWMASLATERYGLFTYLFVVHITNVVRLLFSVLLVVLFFQRRSSFPMLMTIQIISSFAIVAIDEFVAQAIATDGSKANITEIGRGLITTMIWVPYLYMSERVKETFVVRADNDEDDSQDKGMAEQHEMEAAETTTMS